MKTFTYFYHKILILIFSVVAMIAMPILTGGMARADDDVGGDVSDASGLSGDVVVNENIPKIFIKAVNPGYTVDGKSNVGEMIEIGFLKEHPDDVVLLAGLNFIYTNSSGNESELIKISEYFTATGENIILRLASTDDAELANFNYTKTLAFQGGLTLKMGDTVLDAVCWTGKEGCLKVFKSSQPTTLVRNLTTGEFEYLAEYEPIFHTDAIVDNSPSSDSESGEGGMGAAEARCKNLMFSEILSYYAETQDEQFVEFYNSGSEQILLDGCLLEYKNKVYELSGIVKPEEYYVRAATDFSLTKNPTNTNVLKIIDANGAVVDKLEYPNGQRKGTSYAFIGYDASGAEIWRVTYAVTRGEPNNYQEYRTCEAGKVINEVTGNCVKAVVMEEKTCPEGQYVNPLTGRCRKVEVATATVCKDGYYLNPETGRCRKIVENNGANYALEGEEYKEENSFIAVYAVIGVVAVGVVYVIFEFRQEIQKLWRKVFRRARQKQGHEPDHH